jgi:hypothetical protein
LKGLRLSSAIGPALVQGRFIGFPALPAFPKTDNKPMNTDRTDAAKRNGDERQTYPIPVSNDIFAEYRRLGDAIWLYLFYIDRTTEEREDTDGTFVGRVFGGVPRPDADAARALGVCDRTIRNWRERLECEGFIRTKQTGHGSIVEVVNSKKWAWKRKQAARKESSGQSGKNVPVRPERNSGSLY